MRLEEHDMLELVWLMNPLKERNIISVILIDSVVYMP